MTTVAASLAALCPRPLDETQMHLLGLLCEAHETAANANMNASNQMAACMGEANVDLKSAYIASLCSIGGHHAPIDEIRRFLTGPTDAKSVEGALFAKKLPGWGNSFYKDRPDPATDALAEAIAAYFPSWTHDIERITAISHAHGKMIFPNIGLYTAVVANIIDFPKGAELALVVLPRMATWTRVYLNAKNQNA